MAIDNINYANLIDEAMHLIVKKSLQIIVCDRLPGDNHFFISFLTNHQDVELSDNLKNKYPKEMTIVLQYQFEDLKIYDDKFSVLLSFNNVKEKIVIPFKALTAFADPSVKFGLQFYNMKTDEEIELSFDKNINFDKSNLISLKKDEEEIEHKAYKSNNVISLSKYIELSFDKNINCDKSNLISLKKDKKEIKHKAYESKNVISLSKHKKNKPKKNKPRKN